MAASPLNQLIRRYPLTAFFVLAYALSWPYMIVDALGSHGLLAFRLPMLLWIPMGYGPTFAALIVTGALAGKTGIRTLLGRLLIWRVGWPWYAVAVFGSVMLSGITVLLYALLSGTLPVVPVVSAQVLITAPLLFLIGGLVNGEEIGWRGFALPRLLAKHSALTASLILGSLWALFHLPLFFTRGDSFASTPPLSFLVRIIGAAILFTWIYNNTGWQPAAGLPDARGEQFLAARAPDGRHRSPIRLAAGCDHHLGHRADGADLRADPPVAQSRKLNCPICWLASSRSVGRASSRSTRDE